MPIITQLFRFVVGIDTKPPKPLVFGNIKDEIFLRHAVATLFGIRFGWRSSLWQKALAF